MLKQTLAGLAFALISASAFAQYGTWGYNNNTRQWVPPGVVVNQNVQNGSFVSGAPVTTGYPAGAVVVQQGTAAPQGYCSWGDRLVNVGVSAVVGGVIGALAGDSSRTAGQGAAIGGLAGVFIPCQQQAPVVAAPVQQYRGAVTVYAPQQRHYCMVAGRTIEVAPQQSCLALDDAIRAANAQAPAVAPQAPGTPPAAQPQTQGHAVFTPIEQDRPERLNRTCHYEVSTGTYRFNAVNGVRIGAAECNAIINGQRPLPALANLALIF